MNKFLASLLAIVAVLSACTEDIDTLAPYKEVCVVWSFLDKNDTAHYVVVQKGFVNPQSSALDIAQQSDSLYFDEATVTIEEHRNGNVLNTYTLDRVDLKDEGLSKDTGIFIQSPNYAYKLKAPLNTQSTYTLNVKTDNKTYRASTPILNVDKYSLNLYGFQWVDSSKSINFTPETKQRLFWDVGDGKIFDAYLNITYYDVFPDRPSDSIKNTIKWRIVNKEEPYGQSGLTKVLTYSELKNELLNKIPAATNQNRYIGFLDLEFYGGSSRLIEYLSLALAKGGFAAGQVTPEFRPGFESDDIYGLFDSRGSQKAYYLKFSDSTMQLLQYSPDLTKLKIKGQIRK